MNRLRMAFYFFTFLSSLAFERAIFVLFLEERGVSSSQISFLQISLFVSNLLMEVPTGWFADRFGKRLSLILGCLVLALATLTQFLVAPSFGPLLLAFLLYGLGFAFISGSGAALLYENLLLLDRKEFYLGFASKSRLVGSVALGASMFIGGILKLKSWEWVYITTAITSVSAILPLLFLKDLKSAKILDGDRNFRSFGREIAGFLPIVIPISLLHSVSTPLFIFGQKLFTSFGLPIVSVASVIALTEIAGAYLAISLSQWQKGWSLRRTTLAAALGFLLLLSLLLFQKAALSIAIYFLINLLALSILNISGSHFQNKISHSGLRASVLSFITFCDSVAIALGYLWFGFWMERIPVSYAVASSAIFPILSLLLMSRFRREVTNDASV